MTNAVHHLRPAGLLCAAVLSFLVPMVTWAAGVGDHDFVRLRIQDSKGSVEIETPAAALEIIALGMKGDLNMGLFNGHKVTFPMGKLLKIVRGGKAREKEMKFFSIPDPAGPVEFFVRASPPSVTTQGASGPITGLLFSERNPQTGEERLGLAISLDMLGGFAASFGTGSKTEGSDFSPLIRRCLTTASKLGPCVLLRITTDESVTTLTLQ